MEEKRKIILEVKEKLRDEENKFHELFIAKMWEIVNNAPPGSLGDLLKLTAIVQDKAPEAGDALKLLIERHFRRRWVLFVAPERMFLEDMWNLEMFPDQWGEERPRNYEKDVAPLALLETIEVAGDFLLGELKYRMRNFMRNEIVRGGAQGRNIEIKEVENEHEVMNMINGDLSCPDEVLPDLARWSEKEGDFIPHNKKYSNPERLLQLSTAGSPAYRMDPWHPWEVIDIPEEDKPLWEIITKSMPALDDVSKAIVIGIMYDIPTSKTAKALGIPEGTVRSRKSRLLAEARKNATLLQILQQKRPVHPINREGEKRST